jgi:TfoX/Sxy family transcriptional regulator of competence genes
LGYHGLTHETDVHGNFISLQSAIKSSLQLHIETYKHAMTNIDECESQGHNDPAQSSHQRLLSLKYDDIQRRLISNKTLLTKLEVPSLRRLNELIGKLSERVEKDKEALVCLNLIKKVDRDVNLKEW